MANRPRPSRPPPPVPKPGHVKVVRAMYRYEAQQPDELTFDEGDLLYLLDVSNPDWWKGKCGNRTGLIPSNYVEENTESIDCPLHEASKRGNLPFLQECIANNVSVNGLDKAGSTPVHWAAHGGHTECLEEILKVPNCEINVQGEGSRRTHLGGVYVLTESNKLGDTPIHCAAWKGHAEVVRMLLEKGARADLKNNENKLPYELAKDPETAALLRQAVAPRTVSGDYGDGDEDEDTD